MGRIRTIKPDFWKDEELSSVDPESQLLAIGLLNYADDEGYFRWISKLIEAEVFPLRDLSVNVHTQLIQLQKIEYIERFKGSDGKDYGLITNFENHQVVNRPKPSGIKGLRVFTETSVINHTHGTDESLGKGKERKGIDVELAPDNVSLVFGYWQTKLNHPKAVLDPKRKKFIKSALKNYSLEDLKKAIDGLSVTPHNIGKNENKQTYDDIHIVFKDSANIERFMNNAKSNGSGYEGFR